jgi:Flp pilus assembly protein TadG
MKIRRDGGQSLIEFAMVLPLLLILVFGIIDFSIGLYDKAVVTNASREGARAGIVFGTDPTTGAVKRLTKAEIEAVALNYCATYLVTFGSGTVSAVASGAGGASGTPVTVTVTYPYNFSVIGNLIPSLGSPTFQATSVMRME